MSPRPSRPHPGPLLGGLLIPVIAFVVLEQAIGNATGALATTDGIPLLWVLAYGIWRHKVEPVGLIALVVFAIALGLTIALGGSPLPLELRRSFPGAVGLACLVSLAVRRPLLVVASERLARSHAELRREEGPDLDTPGRRRALTILTAVIAVTGLADAVAQIALALTLSTGRRRLRVQARPRARSSRRPRMRSPSTRRPLCWYSLDVHVRSPGICAAVSSENVRSTYMSSR